MQSEYVITIKCGCSNLDDLVIRITASSIAGAIAMALQQSAREHFGYVSIEAVKLV